MKSNQLSSTRAVSRRWIHVILLIAVFFLPLHFHVAVAAPHVANECSCIHGSRTDAGIVALPVLALPVADYWLLEFFSQSEFAFHVAGSKASRAPPSFISI